MPTPTEPTLGNISTRGDVETGDNVLIGGFIISGSESKNVLVRAIGPSLTNFGVAGALANPTLELHHPDAMGNDQILATNDNWMEASNKQAIIDSTLAPANDLESAILMDNLDPGSYTAIVRGANNTTGIGLVEAYDLQAASASTLGNISTRGLVGTNDKVMIGGIIVVGGGSQEVLVRAIGPSLTGFGVAGALADPVIELHDPQGALIETNDNWKFKSDGSSQQAEIEATGLPPTNDAESAILATLNPGAYTAILTGKNNTTGVALVEAYQLD